MPVLIALILLTLLALLFYVGRMLFLAAGTPGGNFDAPSNPSDLATFAEQSLQHDTCSHGHDSGSFDSGSHSPH